MLSLTQAPEDRLTILNIAKSLLKTDGYLVITDRPEQNKVPFFRLMAKCLVRI